jgi:proteasome lid subunit RPN8/RPN11
MKIRQQLLASYTLAQRVLVVALFALFFAVPGFSQPFSPKVQQAIIKIWTRTLCTHMEAAVRVEGSASGFVFDYVDGDSIHVNVRTDDHTIMVIHTHPLEANPMPSGEDVTFAKKNGVPNYVVSVREIWVATPDGKVSKIADRNQ